MKNRKNMENASLLKKAFLNGRVWLLDACRGQGEDLSHLFHMVPEAMKRGSLTGMLWLFKNYPDKRDALLEMVEDQAAVTQDPQTRMFLFYMDSCRHMDRMDDAVTDPVHIDRVTKIWGRLYLQKREDRESAVPISGADITEIGVPYRSPPPVSVQKAGENRKAFHVAAQAEKPSEMAGQGNADLRPSGQAQAVRYGPSLTSPMDEYLGFQPYGLD